MRRRELTALALGGIAILAVKQPRRRKRFFRNVIQSPQLAMQKKKNGLKLSLTNRYFKKTNVHLFLSKIKLYIQAINSVISSPFIM